MVTTISLYKHCWSATLSEYLEVLEIDGNELKIIKCINRVQFVYDAFQENKSKSCSVVTFYGQWLPKIKIEIPIFFMYTSITPMIDPMLGYLVMFRMYNNNYTQCFYEILQAQQKIMTITVTESILAKLCSKFSY